MYSGWFENDKFEYKGTLYDKSGKIIFEGLFNCGLILQECSICGEDETDFICGCENNHIFHKSCILIWFKIN